MSNYCWQQGTITLPSAASAAVKKAVRDAANAHHAAVLAACKSAWAGPLGKTRSHKLYDARLAAMLNPEPESHYNYRTGGYDANTQHAVHDDARLVLGQITRAPWGQADRPAPRQAVAADLGALAPKATNRTDQFDLGEATITFDGRTVTWSIGENNHADDRAHAHPLAKALFAALAKVAWTRGTGGTIWGNSENNEGPHGRGRGEDYSTHAYGPDGDATKIERYRRDGWTAAQAKSMVAKAKQPAPRRLIMLRY